jgi:hypothetical protein
VPTFVRLTGPGKGKVLVILDNVSRIEPSPMGSRGSKSRVLYTHSISSLQGGQEAYTDATETSDGIEEPVIPIQKAARR